jgi:hypothetical protein
MIRHGGGPVKQLARLFHRIDTAPTPRVLVGARLLLILRPWADAMVQGRSNREVGGELVWTGVDQPL